MNYYTFFDIPCKLQIDLVSLKKKYYKNSKLYHPDYFTLESAKLQSDILEKSSINNEGYKKLKDFDKRLKYFLELNEHLEEEGQNTIPQDFLMEMMDYNEQLMELEFDFDPEVVKKLNTALTAINENLKESIGSIEPKLNTEILEEEWIVLKSFYLKRQYLKRLSGNLEKLGSNQ